MKKFGISIRCANCGAVYSVGIEADDVPVDVLLRQISSILISESQAPELPADDDDGLLRFPDIPCDRCGGMTYVPGEIRESEAH